MSNKDLCLLFLDDDEVQGLLSFAILKRLMKTINPNAPSKSCEYFDMVEGTNTDELIVIMLNRLEININECINVYVVLFDQVFRKKIWRKIYFSSQFVRLAGRFFFARTWWIRQNSISNRVRSKIFNSIFSSIFLTERRCKKSVRQNLAQIGQ